MFSSQHTVSLLFFCVAVVSCTSIRQKRQLSPAVGLEDRISPLLMGAMGYGPETYKRSAPTQLKRHISPSFDVEEDMGNFRTLMDIGKRQVSMADDVGRNMQMYNHLFEAGKKRSGFAPSHDIHSAISLSDYLNRAGK